MARNSNENDLDIDELVGADDKPRSGFNGAKIGRFVAVGVFLLLGTFAVIHSMNRTDGHGPSGHDHAATSDQDSDAKVALPNTENKFASIATIGKDVASRFVKPKPGQSPTVDSKKITNSIASNRRVAATRQSAPTNDYAAVLPKPESKKPAVATNNRFGTGFKAPPLKGDLQAKSQPPTRFAQIPGKPLLGSKNGFGEIKTAAKPVTNRFTAPAVATGGFVKQTGDDAKKLLGGLQNQANDLRGKTADKFNDVKSGFNRSNFAKPATPVIPKPSTSQPAFAQTPPKKFSPPQTFTPPKTTNFGGRSSVKPQANASRPSSFSSPGFSPLGTSRPADTTRPGSRTMSASTLPAASSRPPITSVSTSTISGLRSGAPMTRTAASTASPAATASVPGDRRLDGIQAPSLTIEKLSPREIQVNQSADFQIVIRNVGRVAVDNVQVFDRVPDGAEFLGATPNPTATHNKNLTWGIGTVTPGTEKRINIKLKPTRPGEIGSVAQMTFATQSSMRTRVTQPVLEITHRTKPTVLIGDAVMFDVTVTNKGDGPATNVMIQEDIPEQLTFRDGYREIEYEVGTLMPNQSRSIRLALEAKKPGKFKNVIFASGSGGLKSKHNLDMEVVAPQLKTSSDGPTRRFLGRRAKHSFAVANQGTAPASNVNLIARLPAGLRYVNSNNKGTYDAKAHAVFWELAQLRQGANAGVDVETEPVTIGNQPIKFEANADLKLRDTTEQALSVEHLVDVFFDIDDLVDPIEIGSDTRYQVQVVNQGTKIATNVRLEIEFPNGIKPQAVEGPLANKIEGQKILFSPINSLKPNERLTFVVSGTGQTAGDHRVVLKMQTDGRQTSVAKEETTRVYSDR